MKKRRIYISLLVCILLTASALFSGCSSKAEEAAMQIENNIQEQQAKAASFINIRPDNINEQNAMNIIKELASEKYKGRKTGTKENEAALEYISNQFRDMGLKSPESLDNYMQYYYQPLTLLKETPRLSLLDENGSTVKEYEYPKNFAFRVLSDSTENISIKAPMKVMEGVSDIAKQSFSKKEVLLFSAAAQGRSSMMAIINAMYDTDASAIVLEVDVDSENRSSSDIVVTSLNNRSWGEQYKPIITVDSATYAELAKGAAEQKIINLQCSYKYEKSYRTANAVGYIPGTDEKLKNDYIIIAGHMDHVGDNMNGTYNPGALDNASGTAAMMEIARVIAENDIKPKKTLVFIAFNGEEHGLIGSEYYAAEPVFPINNAVMINLDMVGASAEIPLSIAIARGHIVDLRSELMELAKLLEINAVESYIAASDHFYFGEKEVPAVMLENVDSRNGYHSPNDTLEDVDSERIREIIELVLHYVDKKAY